MRLRYFPVESGIPQAPPDATLKSGARGDHEKCLQPAPVDEITCDISSITSSPMYMQMRVPQKNASEKPGKGPTPARSGANVDTLLRRRSDNDQVPGATGR